MSVSYCTFECSISKKKKVYLTIENHTQSFFKDLKSTFFAINLTLSNVKSNGTSTIHCEDSNNMCSNSSYSSSFSRNSSSVYSNDEDDTTKKNSKSFDKNDSFSSSSKSSYYSTHSSVEYISGTSSSNDSTNNSRTTRSSEKSSFSSLLIKDEIKTDADAKHQPTHLKLKCQWENCNFLGKSIDGDDSLIKHLKAKHINNQMQKKRQRNDPSYKCLWKNCKSYNLKSVSFSWLERHVVDHIDPKPFVCIFGECKKKFRTSADLERHVQTHMNNGNNSSSYSPHTSPQKMSQEIFRQIMKDCTPNGKNALKTESSSKTSMASHFVNDKIDCKAGSIVEPIKLPDNFAQVKKILQKRKKTQTNIAQLKKFKKVQYEDYIDDVSAKLLDSILQSLKYDCRVGTISFDFNLVGTCRQNGIELVLVEWEPLNM